MEEAENASENSNETNLTPDVYSGWEPDPFGEAASRYVSGGAYTPFVIDDSGSVLYGGLSKNRLKSNTSESTPDGTMAWDWFEDILEDVPESEEECRIRLKAIPPEIYNHVVRGKSFSNAYWSDDLFAHDSVLIYQASVLCLMWNSLYTILWHDAQVKFLKSRHINRGLRFINDSVLNIEIISIFNQIRNRSQERYRAWLTELAAVDPEHYARVISYEQHEKILSEQRQQTAAMNAQTAELKRIRYTQEIQLREIKNQIDRNKNP